MQIINFIKEYWVLITFLAGGGSMSFIYNKSLPKTIEEMQDEIKSIDELKETVDANSIGMSALKDAIEKLGQQVEIPETPTEEEYPLFVKPSGAHDAYKEGDKITYNNKKICMQNE